MNETAPSDRVLSKSLFEFDRGDSSPVVSYRGIAEAIRTRKGKALSTKRPVSGIPERPLRVRTMPSANDQSLVKIQEDGRPVIQVAGARSDTRLRP